MNKSLGDVVSELAATPPPTTEASRGTRPMASASPGMNTSKTLEYIKRWRGLESSRKQLDYELSHWCHDLRSEFPAGKVGDDKLRDWVDAELDLNAQRREEILTRAAAFLALPDRAQYEGLGGYRHVKALVPLTKRERVSAIGEAKASGHLIGRIARRISYDKHLAALKREREAQPQRALPAIVCLDVHVTPQQRDAWRKAAGGGNLEDWIKSVCNRVAGWPKR